MACPELVLDRARPLWVAAGPDQLTLAVVSVAWLRDLDAITLDSLMSRHLETAERHALPGGHASKRRREWLAGRLAVKHGVAAHRQRLDRRAVAPASVSVQSVASGPRQGKPWVAGPCDISVSHSQDFALAACAPRAVGVDIECARPFAPPLLDLLRSDGLLDCRLADDRDRMPPSVHWACKEAVLKCAGVGLRVAATEVRVRGWHADGALEWTAGAELARAFAGDATPLRGWAAEIAGYGVAVVWR